MNTVLYNLTIYERCSVQSQFMNAVLYNLTIYEHCSVQSHSFLTLLFTVPQVMNTCTISQFMNKSHSFFKRCYVQSRML